MGSIEWGKKVNLAERIGGVMLGFVGRGVGGPVLGLPFLVKARTRLKIRLVWFGKGSQLLQGKGPGMGCSSIIEKGQGTEWPV